LTPRQKSQKVMPIKKSLKK